MKHRIKWGRGGAAYGLQAAPVATRAHGRSDKPECARSQPRRSGGVLRGEWQQRARPGSNHDESSGGQRSCRPSQKTVPGPVLSAIRARRGDRYPGEGGMRTDRGVQRAGLSHCMGLQGRSPSSPPPVGDRDRAAGYGIGSGACAAGYARGVVAWRAGYGRGAAGPNPPRERNGNVNAGVARVPSTANQAGPTGDSRPRSWPRDGRFWLRAAGRGDGLGTFRGHVRFLWKWDLALSPIARGLNR